MDPNERVWLEYRQDLTLRIADDGAGLDAAVTTSGNRGRFGLPGMRERATSIGAKLTIDSTDGPRGTRITLIVPGRSVFRLSE